MMRLEAPYTVVRWLHAPSGMKPPLLSSSPCVAGAVLAAVLSRLKPLQFWRDCAGATSCAYGNLQASAPQPGAFASRGEDFGVSGGRIAQAGYTVTEHVGKYPDGTQAYGVVAVLENGAGPRLLIRTDMDALPVEEKTGLDYASTVRATNAQGRMWA